MSRSVPLTWVERLALGGYSLVLRLFRPLLRRKLARRARTEPGYAHAVKERMGHYLQPLPAGWADPGAWRVWVHAVSLGETRAAAVLLVALRAQWPDMRLLLTHSTATGWAEGQHHLQAGDAQTWLPWDEPAVVQRFLQRFQPSVGVLMETEVWPNLVRVCATQGMPLVLANARLNARSCQQAQRLAWLSGPAYAGLRAVWAQTEADAQRLRTLGAPVQGVWGNLKFDAHPDVVQCETGQRWRQQWQRPVVMLASSRDGEEADFLEQISALALLYKDKFASDFDFLSVVWLLVPRHPQRFEAVAELVRAKGWACVRRSTWVDGAALGSPADEPTVVLGDSLGEMALYYSLSDVALLGGSFAPLGGQNLIEALACACPVVLGPHTFNFAEVSDQAVAAGAAVRVPTLAAAVQVALAWLGGPAPLPDAGEALAEREPHHGMDGPHRRAQAAQAALSLVASGRGTSARTAEALAECLATQGAVTRA